MHWRAAPAIIVMTWLIEGACAQQALPDATGATRSSPPRAASEELPAIEADVADDPTDSVHWHDRVNAARQRHGDWLACVAAKRGNCSLDQARDPMDLLLNDTTLVNGDVVSTPNGLKVFHGRSSVPHTLADFE